MDSLGSFDSLLPVVREPENVKVLIGCELSGVVRRAFDARGFDAWSCDLEPSEDLTNKHIVGDIRDVLKDEWDLMAVFHPPCTRLCNSGVRWLDSPPPNKTKEQMMQELVDGAALFSDVWNAEHIPYRAVENPVMHRRAKELIRNFRPQAQTVQPHYFGDPAFKATCLWLENLPLLEKTNPLTPPEKGTEEHKLWSAIHRAPPSANRSKIRSKTFQGVADAIAKQWGDFLLSIPN